MNQITRNKFCVFCGNFPEKKNREHVLPQWLLELTGNPTRVVDFGINYNDGRTIRFAWNNLCVPACASCNAEYSDLEAKAKSYIMTLLDRGALTSIEYSEFMDWIDKVRIGLWINYHLIQGNPTDIQPRFHIKTRTCQKDRMIAIYPNAGGEIGLNAYGVESLVFHRQPSCFGLRINDIFILNMSADYLFACRCGFPFPRNRFTTLDGENPYMMHLSDFDLTRRIKHPLIRRAIAKPSIHLYQPVMQKTNESRWQSGFLGNYCIFDSYLAKNTMPPYPSAKGILYFQHLDRVEPLFDVEKHIEFENIIGIHSKPMHVLIKQVYELQNFIYENEEFRAEDVELIRSHREIDKSLIKWNKHMISHYSAMNNV
jgi:hypothetical protein